MSRLWTILLTIGIAAGVLAGCSGDTAAGEGVTAAEVVERIRQAVSLQEMKQGDAARLHKLYHIDAELVEDFALYTATSNVRADELLIIKVKHPDDAADVIERIDERLTEQSAKFRDYRPEEHYLIEKHVRITKGRFILLAVSEEAARMGEAFLEMMA